MTEKERPVNFRSNMIEALFYGCKSEVRMVIKPQPDAPRSIYDSPRADTHVRPSVVAGKDTVCVNWRWCMTRLGNVMNHRTNINDITKGAFNPCGKPGDRLWVRETWQAFEPKTRRFGGNSALANAEM